MYARKKRADIQSTPYTDALCLSPSRRGRGAGERPRARRGTRTYPACSPYLKRSNWHRLVQRNYAEQRGLLPHDTQPRGARHRRHVLVVDTPRVR